MKGHLNDKKKTIYLRYNKSFLKRKLEFNFGVRVMVFNATFNNISFISWRSVLFLKRVIIHNARNVHV